ncbi:helix-turn-helix domain-containing protein [Salipiger mangrovisoli]|uniref:Helix-turn-helix domain-containing protein n=1 Tax=Salipiger mangrovisoli TaxID=2865933 RepID=A0ABR9X6N2_9RHOB|nr:helix-turn-helix domain-containing protein [Salipiger mangrovisoli]MBE9639264.1 helix-turn-helix domain-containing protein [Salipiger mangrovisoli]
MPRGPRLTHKDIAEINRLLGEGYPDAEIARRCGRSRQTVARVRNQAASSHTTTDGAVIGTRVSVEEYAAFKALMEAEGLTPSDGMRRLMRLAVGALDLRVEEIEALAQSRRELVAVGRNLNQMTQLANSGRLKWNARDGKTVAQLDARVGDLTEALTNFINVARRRTLADVAFPEADK